MRYIKLFLVSILLLSFSSFTLAQDKQPDSDNSAVKKLAEELAAAKTEEESRLLLEANKDLVTVELYKTMLSQGSKSTVGGNYPQALVLFRLTMNIAERIDYKPGISRALVSIAEVNRLQGNYDEGLSYCRKSLSLSEEIKDKDGIARSLNTIGIILFLQGNYNQSLESYQKSRLIREELNDKEGLGRTIGNMGGVYRLQGNYELALEYFRLSLKICEEMKYKVGIGNALNNIGIVQYYLGDYEQALEYYRRSLVISEELKNRSIIAGTYNNMGSVFKAQGNYEQAMESYQKSLEIREVLNDKYGIASTLNNLADICYSQGNYEQALQFAKRAAEIAMVIGAPEVLWQAKATEGLAFRSSSRPDQSRQSFEEAIQVIEAGRFLTAGGEGGQQQFFEKRIGPYQDMVSLLIEQNKNSEALVYAERAKARVILDILQSGRVNIVKTINAQEQEKEKSFNIELSSLNAQIYRERQREQPNKSTLADLENRLKNRRLEYEAFQTELYAAHPELKAKRVEFQPVTLQEAVDLFPDPRSALLEFVVTEEKTYLFVLTQEQNSRPGLRTVAQRPLHSPSVTLNIYKIDIKRKDLEKRVSEFRNMLAKKDLGFRKPGQELYELLLKPAQEQLKGKTTLVIVPEGLLWELPFQALQTGQSRYLLEDHTIFYTPSLTALREMMKPRNEKRDKKTKTLLALGNPALAIEDSKQKPPGVMGTWGPLPGAELQVKQIARMYGLVQSKYYIGTEAREEQVKAEAGDYKILHFATHGILNNKNPMYSYLVLSQKEGGSSEDGLLESREIVQMELHADLAVLAACETGRGRVGEGEGVIGLAWAFFVAGCPTTVVSQWKVEDTATKDLMLEFHRLLSQGYSNPRYHMSKAAALREAALKILHTSSEPHPFYWAGFVLIGNGQ